MNASDGTPRRALTVRSVLRRSCNILPAGSGVSHRWKHDGSAIPQHGRQPLQRNYLEVAENKT